jgi:hypothetical protein
MNGQTASPPPPVGVRATDPFTTHTTDPRLCPVLRRFVRRRQAFHLAIAGHRRITELQGEEPRP